MDANTLVSPEKAKISQQRMKPVVNSYTKYNNKRLMTGSTIIFYLLGALTLISGTLAVTTRQIFRAAIFLLFSLIGIAGLFFWMQYDFIAAVQIVVYVGGITVLIIFSIFLTQQAGELLPKQKIGRQVFSALAAFCGFAVTLLQVYRHEFNKTTDQPLAPNVSNIGDQMLSIGDNGFALPFELVSILLLAAMIGCIVIATPVTSVKNGKQKSTTV